MADIGWTELTVGVAAVVALFMTVRIFIAYLGKREEEHAKVIENHIDHNTEVLTKFDSTLEKNSSILDRLIDKL